MRFRAIGVSLLIPLVLLAASCGSSGANKRTMSSMALQPAVASPVAGADVQFSATGVFNKPPSPDRVTPLVWVETAADGLHQGAGIASVNQSGIAHCSGSGTTWITATAATGALNMYGDPALLRGTAQLNCP